MMKRVLERLVPSTLFTSFTSVDVSLLQTRKKMVIFNGVDAQSFYHVIFQMEQKSRFVIKHVEEVTVLEQKLALHVKHAYKYKHLFLNAPLCSKAQQRLREEGWRIYV